LTSATWLNTWGRIQAFCHCPSGQAVPPS
jgi:hypothetical protein